MVSGCQILQERFVLQNPVDLLRQSLQLAEHEVVVLLVDGSLGASHVEPNQVHAYKLGRIRLCRSNCDFRSRQCVEYVVGLSGYGASHSVYYAQYAGASFFGVTKGCQRVQGLARLRDGDEQSLVIYERIPVSELRRNVDLNRNVRHLLDYHLAYKSCVVRRTAGDDIDLVDIIYVFLGQADVVQSYRVVRVQSAHESLADYRRLLVDLLEHVVVVVSLVGSVCLPVYYVDVSVDLVAVLIVDNDLVLCYDYRLIVLDEIYVADVLENCRDI